MRISLLLLLLAHCEWLGEHVLSAGVLLIRGMRRI